MTRSPQRMIAAIPGLVFLIFGCLKIVDPAAFAIDIQNYRLLPWTWGVLLALYLPWVEILCGAALFLRIAYRGSLCIIALLLVLFIVAYGSTRIRGLDVACGCFGHGVHGHYWYVLVFDPLLLAIVIWLLRADLRPLSPLIRGKSTANGQPPGTRMGGS